MSLLYSSNFKYLEGDLRKNQEIFMDSSHHYHHHQQQQQQRQNNQQQQPQNNSGLMRYRSAPSSFFDNLANGSSSGTGTGTGVGNGTTDVHEEDYRYFRSSSPEIDTFLAKYGDSGSSDHDHMQEEFGEKCVMKQEDVVVETNGSSQMMYQTLQVQGMRNDNNNNNNTNNTMDSSFGVAANSMMLEKYSLQSKMATGNGSNLIRQSSSPAGLFSNLGVDNGFAVMRAGNNSTTNGAAGPSTSSSRLHNNHINFSSGQSSRLMPLQIAEIGNQNQNTGTRSPEKGLGGSNRQFNMSNIVHSDSWDDISFNGLKRARENDGNNMFFDLNSMDISQNGRSSGGIRSNGLTHHLSLPKTSSEIAAVEKFLHFQGSMPCKIRAKRGCATHPRSIAERVRRTRISERMRKLQDLFPNMDKQANTADMLDLAVEYIKDLQKQVKVTQHNPLIKLISHEFLTNTI
ncbi:hypothetical protein Dsin_010992 [Dipteronia sinensis]|uniref:BHLH domain-containing protein n=1 Tax=Dipteronia sinensis TaxID=43782 RepID=A0AAE0ATT2_9ROSI|nr:hypothetical protein Dsin_010992 [Dipteronia sinensis]